MRPCFLAMALLLLLAFPCTAAQNRDTEWDQLQITGESVEIALTSGVKLQAKVRNMESDALSVRVTFSTDEKRIARGYQTIPRGSIASIRLRKTSHKWTLIGAVVGAGAGAALGAVVLEKESGFAGAQAGTMALGAGLGALAGYFMDNRRPVTVYTAHKQ